MNEDFKIREELAERLQIEVMEDYIRDASQLDEDIIKNEYLREHFTKLVDWIIEYRQRDCKNCRNLSNGSIVKVDKDSNCLFCGRKVG